ncbi:MAG TPA: NERD domain-containing protein [Marmoricola sp.]|nr:NERD domain-containing protein [Marmoricola sp.]
MAELSAQPVARARGLRGKAGKGARRSSGEAQQATEAGLDLLRVLGWLVLHDAAVPGDPEARIDHVLAGPTGVYVVNTVSWSGAIAMRDAVLTVGGTNRSEALDEVAAAADSVREVLGGLPVAPMLCFERLEPVTGVVADVALCASENILDLLTNQPDILDPTAFAKASKSLASFCRPAPARLVVPTPTPARPERNGAATNGVPANGVPANGAAPAVPTAAPIVRPVEQPEAPTAPVVQSAEDIARVAAFERLMTGAPSVAGEHVAGRDESESPAVVVDAGAALWRQLTEPAEDVDAALAEAEALQRDAEESEARRREERERTAAEDKERADAEARAAREALERRARAARERIEREARELAEQEARELAEREAKAEQEAREQEARELAEAEAKAKAEQEAREQEAREQAEAEAKAKAEQEAREQEAREQEAREQEVREQEVREQAEAEARVRAEQDEQERVEQEARDRAEAEARAKVEQAEQEKLLREARERVEQEARERAERAARELAEREAQVQAELVAEDGISAEELARERAAWEALKQAAREERERERREHEELWAHALAAQETRVKLDQEARIRAIETRDPAATETATDEPTSARRKPVPNKALLQVALAAALVAAVIVGAPRLSGLAGWAHGLVTQDAATTVGTAVTVKATSFHPDVQVLAGAPVDVKSVGGAKLPKGQHLVAVPLRLSNQSLVRWDIAPAAKTTVVDGLGVAQHTARGVTVKGLPLLVGTQKIAPGKQVTGYVVFSVPEGRAIRSITLALGESGDQTTWRVAP